jgi:glycosyltransferase involved in cell wall biosynthesis
VVVFKPAANHVRAQPTKLFEYMSAGLPVIASNFPLWREIVERNNCGICVDPLSPAALAEAIRWLIQHPDAAREMGANGRRAVRTTYNWEPEGRKLTTLYRSLLD